MGEGSVSRYKTRNENNALSILIGTEMPAFIFIDCLGYDSISGVDVSNSPAARGVELGRIARARTVDGGRRTGITGSGAVHVPDTSTPT